VNGGTHLVHERALAKLVALKSAVFVTLHDFEVVFRGKGPKISILQGSRSSNVDRNVVSIGTYFGTYAAGTRKSLLDLRGFEGVLESAAVTIATVFDGLQRLRHGG
jgi:hypothetical protein